ncbi:phage tail sheath subtilisin-like domain-containing protein [Oligella urethralis]|uniref:phage tail sheath subtilisin-like domain-containing protein n=1 Tax=Oligella urethralis TaxID=90245 RepID=UPI00288A85E2|nr:phage tail sheath subtilisin-like domain-containing protein [Oligella urethralis]
MASPNISFEQIPSSIRRPGKYFEFNTKLAVRTLPGNLQRVLLVGQRLTSGTTPALTVVDIHSDVLAAEYFGYGSIAHKMARAAIKANPYAQISMVAVDDDDAGVAATGKITVAGTAASVGDVTLTIAGERIAVSITNGEAVDSITSRLTSLINSSPDLPVTAAAALGVITLTAKHKGAAGNKITLSARSTAAEVVTTVTAMASGANDPDLAPALAAAFSGGHTIVVSPFDTSEALSALRDHVDAVGHPREQRDAIGVAGTSITLSAASALAKANNSGLITFAWYPGSVRSAAEIAAAYATVIASEEDPARPLNTLQLKGLDVSPVNLQNAGTEIESALYSGLTPLEVGPGDKVQVVRAISTYIKNAEGTDDVALLDITTMRTLHYVRKAVRERVSLRFPREKLHQRTPPKVRSEILDVLIKLEEIEIIEMVEENKEGLILERDLQDVNRLNAKIPADVVNGLHVFAGRIDLLL